MTSANTSNTYQLEQQAKFGLFLPELYTVAAGGYAGVAGTATAVTHTANAAMVESYWTDQFQNGASTIPLSGAGGTDFLPGIGQCTWTQKNGYVDFEVIFTLNKSPGADPISTPANELRVRPYVSGVANEPGVYLNRLPAPDQHYPMPVFDVKVFDKNDIIAGPFGDGTSHYGCKAHLLMDSSFALVLQQFTVVDGTASTFSALTGTLLGSEFSPAGWVDANGALLRFVWSGRYKSGTGASGRVQL